MRMKKLSLVEEKYLNSLIPKAAAVANAEMKPLKEQMPSEEWAASWNFIYISKMNNLAIAAELRIPFPPPERRGE